MTVDVAVTAHNASDNAAVAAVAMVSDEATGIADLFYRLDSIDYYTDLVRRQAVDAARNADCSWAKIGIAMGVSPQAARKRFAPKDAS